MIVTFYSYKGGVGRSMALANVALLLAQRGLKVLIVDWDLEAPGLERYFSYFEVSSGGPGLLRMLVDACERNSTDFRDYTCFIYTETRYPITLLASGREQDESYSRNLETFDWSAFFAKGGGAFIEGLRDRWREDFDIVLIDSRTGLSDAGGVCTIQLPDAVVAMFTANNQSLYGVRDVMRLAQQARQRLAYDRMPLSVLPLPARWGVQEFQETQIWLDRVEEGVQEFFADWLPRPLQPRHVLESVKIPQIAYFGFGERLAVVEHGTMDPQGMGFAYDRVAAFLATGFQDVSALVGQEWLQRASASPEPQPKPVPAAVPSNRAAYEYDIYVSSTRSVDEWTQELVADLRKVLESRTMVPIRIFFDVSEIRAGENWKERIDQAVERSKIFLIIVTPNYYESAWATHEFEIFMNRHSDQRRIFPVLLRGNLPDGLLNLLYADFRKFDLHRSARESRTHEWWRQIDNLAQALIERIEFV